MVLALALAAGSFLWALGRAFAGQRSTPRFTLSLAALWLLCSLALVGIYVVQELLEGVFAIGHPVGLAGVFGYGGWWAIAVAACLGLVLATVFHGARWVLGEVARPRLAPARRRRQPLLVRPAVALALPRPAPVSRG
jgi:hypothetical protein